MFLWLGFATVNSGPGFGLGLGLGRALGSGCGAWTRATQVGANEC